MERTQAEARETQRSNVLVASLDTPTKFSASSELNTIWTELPSISVDMSHLAQQRIVTADRADKAHVAFDLLRTKLLKLMRQNDWQSVAITSPTPGCGKTVVGLNLAFSFANLRDCRTVLVDLDLRKSKMSKILGTHKPYAIAQFLRGESSLEESFLRYGENLAVGLNSRPVTDAAELLQDPSIGPRLADLKSKLKPSVMIFDLPPMLVNDDVIAFLPNVDCVLLVAAAEASTFNEVDACERSLTQETNFVGVVLNKCRYDPEKYGY